jgi:predicted HTH transcriptional regulator
MEMFVVVDGEEIQWEWKNGEKQFHETWRPKAKGIRILSNVSDALVQRAMDKIMIGVEEENELVRNKINENARKRRAKNKSDNRTLCPPVHNLEEKDYV